MVLESSLHGEFCEANSFKICGNYRQLTKKSLFWKFSQMFLSYNAKHLFPGIVVRKEISYYIEKDFQIYNILYE